MSIRPPSVHLSVTLRVPPLKTEVGWTGELSSKTNLLNGQNKEKNIFLAKKKYLNLFLRFLRFSIFFLLIQFFLLQNCRKNPRNVSLLLTSSMKVYITWYQTWKKTIFTPARFEQKLFYPIKCITCNKSDFATKQRKMYE